MVDNILSVINDATPTEYHEGMIWYNRVNAWCWGTDYVDYRRAAGIVAVLSPLLPWQKNMEYAEMVYAGKTDIPCLPQNAAKAIAIFNGANVLDVVSGPKVTAFFRNIVNPYSDNPRDVTIDKHAHDIATGDRAPYHASRGINGNKYIDIANAYVDAARILGVLPLQAQAIAWTVHRNLSRSVRYNR